MNQYRTMIKGHGMTSQEKFLQLLGRLEDQKLPSEIYLEWEEGEEQGVFLRDILIRHNKSFGFDLFFQNPTLSAGHPRRLVPFLSEVGFDILLRMADKWAMGKTSQTDYSEDIFDKADRLRADCI